MFKWLLFLIFYLSLSIALNPGFRVDLSSLRVLILIFFLVWLIKKSLDKSINWRDFFNLQVLGLLGFLILAGLSILNAENYTWSLRKILFFLSIFPLYFLVFNLTNNWADFKKVVWILIIGSSSLALIGLIQFLAQFVFGLERVYSFWAYNILPVFSGFNLGTLVLAYPSWLVNVSGATILRACSLFSDPHIFSFYLGLVLPLIISLLVFNKNKLGLWFSYGILVLSLFLSFTRGAYIALIVSFLIFSFLIFKYLKIKKIPLILLLTLCILIIPNQPISERFFSSFDLSEGSNLGRLEMWQESSQIGLNNFLLGIGLGNYSLKIDADSDYRNPITAHNFYLDLFSEMGILALIIWLVLILGTIYQLFLNLKSKFSYQRKVLSIGCIGSLSYFLVHAFFETPIYSPSFLALLMVILALASLIQKHASENN